MLSTDVTQELASVINLGLGLEWLYSSRFKGYASFTTDYSAKKRGTETNLSLTDWDIHHLVTGAEFAVKKSALTVGLGLLVRRPGDRQRPAILERAGVDGMWDPFDGLKFRYATYKLIVGSPSDLPLRSPDFYNSLRSIRPQEDPAMNVSRRGHDIQASPIRKLKPYADAAKAKGVKVFHLNIGDPDIPAPGPVMDTFHNWNQPVLGYGPAQGFLELREAVTRYFAKYDIPLGPDEVLITTGGSEAIHFTFSVIGDVGDEIVIPEPYYTNYNGYAVFAGLKIVPLPLSVEDGFRLPPVEAIEARITPRTKAILLCSPNNPTGTVYTPEEIEPRRRPGQEARPLPRRRRGLQGVHLRRPEAQEHPRVRGHQGPGRRRRQHLQALQLLRRPDRHDHHPQQGRLRGRPQVRPGPALPAVGRADGRPGRLQHAHGVFRRASGPSTTGAATSSTTGSRTSPASSSASPRAPSTSSSACRSRTSSTSPSGSSRSSRSTARRS